MITIYACLSCLSIGVRKYISTALLISSALEIPSSIARFFARSSVSRLSLTSTYVRFAMIAMIVRIAEYVNRGYAVGMKRLLLAVLIAVSLAGCLEVEHDYRGRAWGPMHCDHGHCHDRD